MMKFELFEEVIVERIPDFMPPFFEGYRAGIEKVPKVNGTKDALIFKPESDQSFLALPIVYLDEMYELFEVSEDMDEILRLIAGILVNYTGSIRKEDIDVDYSERKDNIILSLINTEINEEMLKNIPHVEILNMSVIFRMIMRWSGDGFDSVIINRVIMDELGMNEEELFELATENTKRIFPPTLEYLDDNVYLITNEGCTFGATSLIYADFMKRVAETIGDDSLYIIPSSIHELFAVSSREAEVEDLVSMLAHGNTCVTRQKEVLSNSIYEYDSTRGKMSRVASYM